MCSCSLLQLILLLASALQNETLSGAEFVLNSFFSSFTLDMLAVAQTTEATIALDATVGGTLARVILEAFRHRHNSTPALPPMSKWCHDQEFMSVTAQLMKPQKTRVSGTHVSRPLRPASRQKTWKARTVRLSDGEQAAQGTEQKLKESDTWISDERMKTVAHVHTNRCTNVKRYISGSQSDSLRASVHEVAVKTIADEFKETGGAESFSCCLTQSSSFSGISRCSHGTDAD